MGAVQIATGLVASDSGVDAFAEAASRAQLGLGGAPADLVAVFGASANLDSVEDGLAAVEARLGSRALMGCGAQGVLGDGREVEQGGVVVWAASLDEGEVQSFHLEPVAAGDDGLVIAGLPELDDADALIMLADPYSFPIEPLLAQLGEDFPGLPIIGGLASARGPDGSVLLHDDAVVNTGAVGAVLRGVDVRACVSQGARPIGPEMVITAADGNVVYELASRPALVRLREAIGELDTEERMLAANGLLLGIVIDENRPEYERGDFLVRGLVDVDEESGAVTVGDLVRVGQTARLQVRDGASADEDLREVLMGQLRELRAPPAGALVFTCNGRGVGMFGSPDHDAAALEDAFGRVPAAGFFCAGEIGPVGRRNFLHGFTATMAVFPG
ncbi:MAG TPA: FIST N-terminal domain-containing protein [Thermoleophilaceae bacterium]|jgi:small ligand-binding sensory domain FIST